LLPSSGRIAYGQKADRKYRGSFRFFSVRGERLFR
jgi:hypothetical protein